MSIDIPDLVGKADWLTPLCAMADCLLHRRIIFGVAEASMSWYMICARLRERNITPRWHMIDQKRHIFNIDAGIANLAWRVLNKSGAEMLMDEPRNPR